MTEQITIKEDASDSDMLAVMAKIDDLIAESKDFSVKFAKNALKSEHIIINDGDDLKSIVEQINHLSRDGYHITARVVR